MLSNSSTSLTPGQAWLAARRDAREYDAQGNTLITPRYLKQLCKEQKLYQTPELNDIIYLHFKGFAKIENLEPYKGLKSLWLEGNGISKIENIDALTELRCLFLQQNCITDIENLSELKNLDTLNLCNNLIKHIANLDCLPVLKTLQLSHNFLRSAKDIEHLAHCHAITVLDLSHNKIDDEGIVDIIETMPSLAVLNLMANPVIRQIQSYRKVMVSRCKHLTYLDDRPVFDNERLATEAWAKGGLEAEREERQRQRNAEIEQHNQNFEAMRKLQEAARAKRLETYGPDQETVLSEPLEQLRKEMLSKIDDGASDSGDLHKNSLAAGEESDGATAADQKAARDAAEQHRQPDAGQPVEDASDDLLVDIAAQDGDGQSSDNEQQTQTQEGMQHSSLASPADAAIASQSPTAHSLGEQHKAQQEQPEAMLAQADQEGDERVERTVYTRPTEQREADRSLLHEMAYTHIHTDDDDDVLEPLLAKPADHGAETQACAASDLRTSKAKSPGKRTRKLSQHDLGQARDQHEVECGGNATTSTSHRLQIKDAAAVSFEPLSPAMPQCGSPCLATGLVSQQAAGMSIGAATAADAIMDPATAADSALHNAGFGEAAGDVLEPLDLDVVVTDAGASTATGDLSERRAAWTQDDDA
ncbi:hypothetical protein BC831DRAFT_470632 [Entophlyctis helioformis]|nr:hypothetical protein BC831DRAFT_470632 [Entophlyctis helioformis]